MTVEEITVEEIKLPAWISEVESLALKVSKGTLPSTDQILGIHRVVPRLAQEIRDLMAIVHDLRQDAPTVYTLEQEIQGERPEARLLGVYHSQMDALRHMSNAISSLRDHFVPWSIFCFSWEGGERKTVVSTNSLVKAPDWA